MRFEPLRDAQGQPVVRPPKKGEWFAGNGDINNPIPCDNELSERAFRNDHRPILRRIEEPAEPQADAVNSPPHYQGTNGIECIDAIRGALTPEEFRGYCKGNIYKYLWRMDRKGVAAIDVDKALWYTTRLHESFAGCRAAVELRNSGKE